MRIHHLNCGTMCPRGGALLGGEGPPHRKHRLVCHVLLIETSDGLALVDTGLGTDDIANPKRLGQPFRALVAPELRQSETAIEQVKAAGFDPADVRHILMTHLDVDHAGGIPDFPDAEIHVFEDEHQAALNPSPREKLRYIKDQFAHGPRFVPHRVEGDKWFGFESVRLLPGLAEEVVLVPVAGHSRGHSAIAVRDGERWLMHCGDAYFNRGEMRTPPEAPPGLRLFQNVTNVNRGQRIHNQERLRELARDHGDEVDLICSHDAALMPAAAAELTPRSRRPVAADHQPGQPDAEREQRDAHRGAGHAERDDRAREIERQLDREASEEQPGPHPGRAGERAHALGVGAPVGAFAIHLADDEPDQRPPHRDRHEERRGVGRIRDQPRKVEVLSPAAAVGDERGDGNAEEARERVLRRFAPREPEDRDRQRQRRPRLPPRRSSPRPGSNR